MTRNFITIHLGLPLTAVTALCDKVVAFFWPSANPSYLIRLTNALITKLYGVLRTWAPKNCCWGELLHPNHPPNFVAELHDVLNTVVTRHPAATIFLMSDFNFSNINWFPAGPTDTPFSSQSSEFPSLCSLFSLTQLVTQPTRIANDSANVLSLILTSHPDIASDISYYPL